MKYLKWIRPIGCKVNYFTIVMQKMPHFKTTFELNFPIIALNNIIIDFFSKKLDFYSYIWHNWIYKQKGKKIRRLTT
jgi:hypothetical protein